MTPFPQTQAFLASNLDHSWDAIMARLDASDFPSHRVLLIPTATFYEDRPLKDDIPNLYLHRGANLQVLDLRDVPGGAPWSDVLHTYDIVHFCGGNTFGLLHDMKRTGLLDAMQNEASPKTYIGESAGAIVFGHDIAHIAALDEPSVAPGLRDTSGMKWLTGDIVPHYKSPEWGFGAKIDAALPHMQAHQKGTTLLLTDAEYIHITYTDCHIVRV